MTSPPISRALISVSDKSGLLEFAKGLVAAGVEIYSTGGTRKHLEDAGLEVRDVADYTGFPEMLEGRVKTLHPKVHGGILCRHDRQDDRQAIAAAGIVTFELVVVNLYPFAETIARDGVTDEEAIENIDIGGPSMVRAAAKNHPFVTVVTSSEQYADVLAAIVSTGCTTYEMRRQLAGDAFEHTACYDRAVANYFARTAAGDEAAEDDLPATISLSLKRRAKLRYGENPHQSAALYEEVGAKSTGLINAKQLNGKELSYNNLLDLESALALVRVLDLPAVSVVKHNNPCGAAAAESLCEAAGRAMQGDPLSAFGSVLAMNRTLDRATAEVLTEPGLFIEAIVAPGFEPEALEILTTRPKWKANVRLMDVGPLSPAAGYWDYRRLEGGFLRQEADVLADPQAQWKVVTKRQPTDAELADLRFAWTMVRFVKSNAIVICREQALWGAGAGQMSRVDSVEIAITKSADRAQDSVLGSDAFFPFPDSIDLAAKAGVAAVIQPGGSRKDNEVIEACDRHSLAMIFTGRRHFKH